MILKHEMTVLAALEKSDMTIKGLMDVTGCTSRGSLGRLMQHLFDEDKVRFYYFKMPGRRNPERYWKLK